MRTAAIECLAAAADVLDDTWAEQVRRFGREYTEAGRCPADDQRPA
jgi:hypothetical protein